ncbi:MAG: DUF7519 family protein [Halobacteriota archaeon]
MDDEDIDRRPTMLGVLVAVFAAFAIGVLFSQYSMIVTAPVALGLIGLLVGGSIGNRQLASAGIALVVLAILMAGLYNYPVSTILATGVLAVVSWDAVDNGFTMGRQLGRVADTRRAEVLHLGATILSGTVVAGVIYGIFVMTPAGWPLTALVLTTLAAVLLALALEL